MFGFTRCGFIVQQPKEADVPIWRGSSVPRERPSCHKANTPHLFRFVFQDSLKCSGHIRLSDPTVFSLLLLLYDIFYIFLQTQWRSLFSFILELTPGSSKDDKTAGLLSPGKTITAHHSLRDTLTPSNHTSVSHHLLHWGVLEPAQKWNLSSYSH